MVWWCDLGIENAKKFCELVKSHSNRTFPATNIIFTFDSCNYNRFDVYSLSTSGVNIFNVDVTVHETSFYYEMKQAVRDAERIAELYQVENYRPITLAVTMNVDNTFELDEQVDIVILKDQITKERMREFRKRCSSITCLPILITITQSKIEDIDDLKDVILLSDGVVVDTANNEGTYKINHDLLQKCKQLYRPVIGLYRNGDKEENSNEDGNITCIIAKDIIEDKVDGIVIENCLNYKSRGQELFKSLMRELVNMREEFQARNDYFDLIFKTKIPVIPPLSAAFSASLTALQSSAYAIIVLSASGKSARMISNAMPPCAVVAVTSRQASARRIHLYRKIIPLFYDKRRASNWFQEYQNRVYFGTRFIHKIDLAPSKGKVVVLAPSEEGVGYCNMVQVITMPVFRERVEELTLSNMTCGFKTTKY